MEIKVQDQPNAAAPIGEPVASDIKKAVEEADLRGRIEAGGKFIEEMTQSVEAENHEKKSQKSDDDSKENRSGRDTAALSEESVYYKLSPDELSDLDKMWGKEEADLAWQDILNWSPSLIKSVMDELNNLAEIYKELLCAILENTTAGVKEEQLAALDQILSDILMKILNTRMGELESLLKNFGTRDSMAALRAALYRSITGNALNDKELEQIFKGQLLPLEDTAYAKSMNGVGAHTGNIHIPLKEAENQVEQGIIYQPAGDGRIKNNPQYAQRMRREAAVSAWGGKTSAGTLKVFGAQASISPMEKSTVYSSKDLEMAERFAGYMNRAGNLFRSAELSGGNEELYGFLAALMAIKSQTYTIYSGIDKGLASDLREAIDKMIDFYIQDAFKQSNTGREGRAGSQKTPFQPRAAYKIYYYMMNLYQTTSNLRETANKGLRHAYQQFLKKKECSKNDEDSGSFFTKEKKDAVEDWKQGKRFLERDWKEFLTFMDREDLEGFPLGVMELSPWGMFVEPEKTSSEGESTGSPYFLIGAAATILMLILFVSFIGF